MTAFDPIPPMAGVAAVATGVFVWCAFRVAKANTLLKPPPIAPAPAADLSSPGIRADIAAALEGPVRHGPVSLPIPAKPAAPAATQGDQPMTDLLQEAEDLGARVLAGVEKFDARIAAAFDAGVASAKKDADALVAGLEAEIVKLKGAVEAFEAKLAEPAQAQPQGEPQADPAVEGDPAAAPQADAPPAEQAG